MKCTGLNKASTIPPATSQTHVKATSSSLLHRWAIIIYNDAAGNPPCSAGWKSVGEPTAITVIHIKMQWAPTSAGCNQLENPLQSLLYL